MTTRFLEVLSPGFLTTVQDLGRAGRGALGIPPSGVLDDEAIRWANRLVGNPEEVAGLEVWFQGPVLRASCGVAVAVAGGTFGPAPGRVLRLAAGQEIALTSHGGAVRAVVAISGGIDVPVVLGSRSTSLSGGFGGIEGRRLGRGDRLPLGDETGPPLEGVSLPSLLGEPGPEVVVRLGPGPQEDLLEDAARDALYGSSFTVSPESNRVGFRLIGPALDLRPGPEIASEGATFGTLQVTTGHEAIVLLSEGPTTGGYPKVGAVIASDRGRLVRVRSGQRIRFERVTWEEARKIQLETRTREESWTPGESP